jgi:hypothetical protein
VRFEGKGEQWERNCSIAFFMLSDAGIKIRTVPWIPEIKPIGSAYSAYRALFQTPADKAHLVKHKEEI